MVREKEIAGEDGDREGRGGSETCMSGGRRRKRRRNIGGIGNGTQEGERRGR